MTKSIHPPREMNSSSQGVWRERERERGGGTGLYIEIKNMIIQSQVHYNTASSYTISTIKVV